MVISFMDAPSIEELAEELRAKAGWQGRLVTRFQAKRVTQAAIDSLPENWPVWSMHTRPHLNTFVFYRTEKTRRLYRQRHGRFSINPFVMIFIEILVKLLIEWWLSREENQEAASRMRTCFAR